MHNKISITMGYDANTSECIYFWIRIGSKVYTLLTFQLIA